MGAMSHETNHAWRVALPWHGRVGEFVVLTPFGETVFESEDPGYASLWVCVRASDAGRQMKAVWERVELDEATSQTQRAAASAFARKAKG